MLVLGRYESEWVEITHKSGDVIRIRVNRIDPNPRRCHAKVDLAFEDDDRNFEIARPERVRAEPRPMTPIDPKYYRGTLIDPGFNEYQR